MDRTNKKQSDSINQVRTLGDQLTQQRNELEAQQTQLQEQVAAMKSQADDVKAQIAEAKSYYDSLDAEVKKQLEEQAAAENNKNSNISTAINIVDNPKNLKFQEVEAAAAPRVLQDVDAAIINGNYAIPAGLNAATDGIYVEGADSPYVNVVVVREGRENDPAILALVKALQSNEIKNWVAATYPDGNVVTVY